MNNKKIIFKKKKIVTKFWGLSPTFVDVSGEKMIEGNFLNLLAIPPRVIPNKVNAVPPARDMLWVFSP